MTALHTTTVPAITAVKNVALFIAAPFVALVYIIIFPLVGLGIIAWYAARAAAKYEMGGKIGRAARNLGLLLAAPFVALAYVVLFPFVGFAMLAWMGTKALTGAEHEASVGELPAAAVAA
jgi:hypothetical protein